jgi:hypothetical protein
VKNIKIFKEELVGQANGYRFWIFPFKRKEGEEHTPPHLHVEHHGRKGRFYICNSYKGHTGDMFDGNITQNEQKFVKSWILEYKSKLNRKWRQIQKLYHANLALIHDTDVIQDVQKTVMPDGYPIDPKAIINVKALDLYVLLVTFEDHYKCIFDFSERVTNNSIYKLFAYKPKRFYEFKFEKFQIYWENIFFTSDNIRETGIPFDTVKQRVREIMRIRAEAVRKADAL